MSAIPSRQAGTAAPLLAEPGPTLDGTPVAIGIDPAAHYPDARSHRLKLGLLVPATNTSMEHDLWTLLARNADQPDLAGVGIHTTNVVTPVPRFGSAEELSVYRDQFLAGLEEAVPIARMAEPDHIILGMSLEHILTGLEAARAPARHVARTSGLAVTAWDEAAKAALDLADARRIALLTPFDPTGNDNARRMFEDLGFEVTATLGFSCSLARHVAHVPDWAKEKAVLEYLAPPGARVDAVVQCGTNMSFLGVGQRLEVLTGIPMLGINAILLWHALRANGITSHLEGAGRLLAQRPNDQEGD